MKKFLHKIIVLNQQEQQEAELRTRIAKHLSGRVRPPDVAMQKELLCKGSRERVHAPSRHSLFTTFVVNFGHLHESAAHKKLMGMVIILAGFEINVLKTSMTEPIFGCGKQTASDTPATRSSIDKNITEDAERSAAVGIGFEDAEAEQLSCGIFRLEYRCSIRRHVLL